MNRNGPTERGRTFSPQGKPQTNGPERNQGAADGVVCRTLVMPGENKNLGSQLPSGVFAFRGGDAQPPIGAVCPRRYAVCGPEQLPKISAA